MAKIPALFEYVFFFSLRSFPAAAFFSRQFSAGIFCENRVVAQPYIIIAVMRVLTMELRGLGGGYRPVWTQNHPLDNVIDMSTYTNGGEQLRAL